MQAVYPLIGGVSGAALGTAELYRRGTATRATWYTTFEGDGANATGADITLDSNGGAVVFVNELVLVIVKDASGTTVREFVAGESDNNVEVVSPSFTGTDYASGATGANKPTTLATVLDAVITSFGSTNWNVLIGGVSVPVSSALAGSALFINVKSSEFGAVGDGVTDDTASINAAIIAASTRGAIFVFFPPGTYLISATINLKKGVNLVGVQSQTGALCSNILRDSSDYVMITIESGSLVETTISHLALSDADSGGNEAYISVPEANSLRMEFCQTIAPANAATGGAPVFDPTCGTLQLRSCQFNMRGGTGGIVVRGVSSLTLRTSMIDCLAVVGGTIAYATTCILNGIVQATNNFILCNFTTALLPPTQLFLLYTPSTMVGNIFSASISDTIVAISADGSAGAGTVNGIVEAGNQFEDTFFVTGQSSAFMSTFSRQLRRRTQTIAAPGTLNLQAADAGILDITTTGIAGAYVMAFPTTGVPLDATLDIIIRNTTAANHTIDTTGTSPVDAAVAVNANLILRTRYVYTTVGATTAWWRMAGFTVTVV